MKPARAHPAPLLLCWLAVLAAILSQGCATARPASYGQEACQQLRRDARKAGAYRVGASSVAAGLAAGGAVAELVTDSRGAQVGLALGAVLFGALGLAAGWYGDDASEEWREECVMAPSQPVPVPTVHP